MADWTDSDPSPSHRALVCAGHDEVHVPNGGSGQRPALVRATTLVAGVGARGSVVDAGAAVAVRPAPAELGVERVQDVCVERTDLDMSDKWHNVLADVSLILLQCASVAVEHL